MWTRAKIHTSSSYDGEIFERGQWRFAISERLRHNCCRLRGTLRLAVQMASTNLLLPTLPRFLGYVVFFTLILFSLFLFILMHHARKNEGPDLLEAMKSAKRVLKSFGIIGVILLMLSVAGLGCLMFVLVDKVESFDAKLLAILVYFYLLFLFLLIK